jgi:hypothetical protein
MNDVYNFYHTFLHAVANRKIMLMTGTPMRNYAHEIAKVMNLILPMTQQLPTQETFDRLVFEQERIRPDAMPMLVGAFQGRTSYLKNIDTTVRAVYQGEVLDTLEYVRVVPSVMSEFQDGVYRTVYGLETAGLRQRSEQASLFVFPNGDIGNPGLRAYKPDTQFNAAWRDIWRTAAATEQTMLERVRQFSCKYASILEEILRHPQEKCFVFNESIMEGGALVFTECLRLFGFSAVRKELPPDAQPARRFILLSTAVTDERNFARIIKSFNDDRNRTGQYIQVLVGGIQISEGYTFKDVTQMHVAVPHWNFAVVDQAIARTIRFRSHHNVNAQVRIFLHVALPIDQEDAPPSIDMWTYRTAELKDIGIKRLERIIERASMDCAVNYTRNQTAANAEDNSRDCFYGDCLYRCIGVRFPYVRAADELDYTTFRQFYEVPDMEIMVTRLRQIFAQHFHMHMRDLVALFPELDPQILCSIVSHTCANRVLLQDAYGMESTLHVDGDVLFLSSLFSDARTSVSDAVYTASPVLVDMPVDFSGVLERAQRASVLADIRDIVGLSSVETQLQRVMALPKSVQTQFLETAVAAHLTRLRRITPLTMRLVQSYRRYLYDMGDGVFYSTYNLSFNVLRKWTRAKGWHTAPLDDEALLLDRMRLVRGNPYRYYLRYEIPRERHSIVVMGVTRSARDYTLKGTQCATLKNVELQKIVMDSIGHALPRDVVREGICEALLKWFQRANRVLYFG